MELTFGSLFAGIGGIDLGLERVGMECRWQVEIDPWCRRVLAKHWPDVRQYTDVRRVGYSILEPVDLICGGFPCQDISVAGKRAGIEGERSGLWTDFARIVRVLRPRYVLVENVANLLAGGIERVLADLAESGYDAEWDCIPAAAVGAPHRRDRVYLVAHSRGLGTRQQEPRPERETAAVVADDGAEGYVAHAGGQGLEERQVLRRDMGKELPATQRGGYSAAVADSHQQRTQVPPPGIFTAEQVPECNGWWATEPAVGRVAHGVPNRVDRLRGLGNAVVPQVAEFIGRLIVEHHQRTE